jgi:hypothetical protein
MCMRLMCGALAVKDTNHSRRDNTSGTLCSVYTNHLRLHPSPVTLQLPVSPSVFWHVAVKPPPSVLLLEQLRLVAAPTVAFSNAAAQVPLTSSRVGGSPGQRLTAAESRCTKTESTLTDMSWNPQLHLTVLLASRQAAGTVRCIRAADILFFEVNWLHGRDQATTNLLTAEIPTGTQCWSGTW